MSMLFVMFAALVTAAATIATSIFGAGVDDGGSVRGWVIALLGPGAGLVEQSLTPWLISEFQGGFLRWRWDPSPRGKRWIAVGEAVIVPSLLYAVLGAVIFGWWPYSIEDHVQAIGTAFLASQILHGATRLSTEVQPKAPVDGSDDDLHMSVLERIR